VSAKIGGTRPSFSSNENNLVESCVNFESSYLNNLELFKDQTASDIKLYDPNNNGYILTIVGPPGVGKTTISNMISDSIGMGFNQISCGSINDPSVITGNNSVYIGSKPGILTQQLIHSKQLDNVIVFDELDKIHDSKVIPILLHVLDKTQNSRFKDAYCPEIDINLSKNLYIITVNSTDNLDSALKDRLKIINIDGYTIEQKVQICIKHTIPLLIKKTGLNLSFDAKVIKECVIHISSEISGIRSIERFFSDVFEKILLIKKIGPSIYGLPANFKFNNHKVSLNVIKKLDNYF
jgi:ATP-dependent Lon protease